MRRAISRFFRPLPGLIKPGSLRSHGWRRGPHSIGPMALIFVAYESPPRSCPRRSARPNAVCVYAN